MKVDVKVQFLFLCRLEKDYQLRKERHALENVELMVSCRHLQVDERLELPHLVIQLVWFDMDQPIILYA